MASEYGWAQKEILDDVSFDEALIYSDIIDDRHFAKWRMELAIVQNPHLKPEDQRILWDKLSQDIVAETSQELDREGVDKLKQIMSKGKAFAVK